MTVRRGLVWFGVWGGDSMSNLRFLSKHTPEAPISDLKYGTPPQSPPTPPPPPPRPETAKPQVPGQLSLWANRLSERGITFYFRKSDQIKLILVKKYHRARRTASTHRTQNSQPQATPLTVLMAKALPLC